MSPTRSENSEPPKSAPTEPAVVLPARLQREYEVVAKLGQGGMGAVYQARHRRLKRFVAIKVLPAEKTKDAAAVARFQREMEAIGQLRHPNVIEAHDAGEDEGVHFLIVEYVAGLDLTAVANAVKTTVADAASVGTRTEFPSPASGAASAPRLGGIDGDKDIGGLTPPRSPVTGLRVADACEIVRQAALGLQHAHEHGLVHRDIKPSNLLLGWADGQHDARASGRTGGEHNHSLARRAETETVCIVKILDLGLALLHGEHLVEDLTSTGQVMGTIDYMAPEQIADTHRVDIRADIYSLGCTLYRLLAGKAPFAGPEFTTLFKKMKAHESAVAAPLSQLRADVPLELEALLARMLAKDPAERFALPRDVSRAIEPFCAGANLTALLATAQAAQPRASSAAALASTVVPNVAVIAPRDEPSAPNSVGEAFGSSRGAVTATLNTSEAQPDSTTRERVVSDNTTRERVVSGNTTTRLRVVLGWRRVLAVSVVACVAIAGLVSRMGGPGRPAVPNNAANTQSTTSDNSREDRTAEGGQPTNSQSQIPADPDRAAAEWVLSLKAAVPPIVGIQISREGGGAKMRIAAGTPLPSEPFRLLSIIVSDPRDESDVSDANLARYIAPLPSLLNLWLDRCANVTDASVPTIKQLSSLKQLHVVSTKLSGAACLELATALPLFAIDVSTEQFSDELAAFIRTTPRITYVELNGGNDAQLRQLLAASHITDLVFAGGASAEMATWRELPDRLPNLRSLSVTSAGITDAHLSEFSRCPKLIELGLHNNPITDAGLPALHGCQTLRTLDLTNTQVTAEAVRALHDHLPLCRITHPNGVLEPKAEASTRPPPLPADPDRAAAEWVLAQKTAETLFVGIQVTGSPQPAQRIPRGEPLPDKPFQVVELAILRGDITDRDLAKYLPRLTRLARLELVHCPGITDAAVDTLREIGSLRFLALEGTALSPPAALELIQTLPLEVIGLSARSLTPKVIDLVCATPRIKQVRVTAGTPESGLNAVTDEQLQSLFRAQQLSRLIFNGVTAKLATWRELPERLPDLTELYVDGPQITDTHLTEFARLTKLEYLGLVRTSITDAGLSALNNNRALRRLDLSQTAVTAEAVRALSDHIPLCRITHPGGIVEPKSP